MEIKVQKVDIKSAVKEFIVTKAKQASFVKKIVLFGSRARLDNTDRSDYDLAVFCSGANSSDKTKFKLELIENVPTLCGLDVVFYEDILNEELKTKITKEGVSLYEKK